MKNKFLKILSKPQIVIPSFTLIGIIITIFFYGQVGKAPAIDIKGQENMNPVLESGTNINLSFPKSGRVKEVSVVVGQKVYKGQVLAKLLSPDGEGAVSQAKGALELAEAQYSSLNSQYASTKKQQDLIVDNAYRALLSAGLEAIPDEQTSNSATVTGTYTCGKEGSYTIDPYRSSDGDTGYSFQYSGLESGTASVKYKNSVPFGNCGLQIKWAETTYFDDSIDWTINIPNKKSSSYITYKNAYDLAVETREKVLSDLAVTIGKEDSTEVSVAKAQVNAARGAYEAALGAYQNNLILSPLDGVVNFVDENLKVGQSVVANKNVISITKE
jgi:multidrug efflux pump subunit AcrA (membrane-fusion protein)